MKEQIPGQPNQKEIQKSNVIDFEGERKKRLSKDRRSLQGPTTFDIDRSEETRKYFRKSQEEARKEWRKGMIQTAVIWSIFAASPFTIATLKYVLNKKEVSAPPRIEIKEQGRKSHPSPVPGVPYP